MIRNRIGDSGLFYLHTYRTSLSPDAGCLGQSEGGVMGGVVQQLGLVLGSLRGDGQDAGGAAHQVVHRRVARSWNVTSFRTCIYTYVFKELTIYSPDSNLEQYLGEIAGMGKGQLSTTSKPRVSHSLIME